jgi:hypothetical protein
MHLRVYEHPVKDGQYQDFKDQTWTLLREQVERTPYTTNSAIVMEATKELVGELLLGPQDVPVKTFTFEELVPALDKWKYMSLLSIWNDMTTFKYLWRFGVMYSITMLRGCSHWPNVQKNMFPSQGFDFDKVFLFKMSEVGPGSCVVLVKRMQPGGDLQDAWIRFDHVKHIKKWTTMIFYVYDSLYYRIMTIVVCDI